MGNDERRNLARPILRGRLASMTRVQSFTPRARSVGSFQEDNTTTKKKITTVRGFLKYSFAIASLFLTTVRLAGQDYFSTVGFQHKLILSELSPGLTPKEKLILLVPFPVVTRLSDEKAQEKLVRLLLGKLQINSASDVANLDATIASAGFPGMTVPDPVDSKDPIALVPRLDDWECAASMVVSRAPVLFEGGNADTPETLNPPVQVLPQVRASRLRGYSFLVFRHELVTNNHVYVNNEGGTARQRVRALITIQEVSYLLQVTAQEYARISSLDDAAPQHLIGAHLYSLRAPKEDGRSTHRAALGFIGSHKLLFPERMIVGIVLTP